MFSLDLKNRKIILESLKKPKQILESEISSSCATDRDEETSLIEIENNRSITQKRRDRIEKKFKKSTANKCYVLPRNLQRDFSKLPNIQLKSPVMKIQDNKEAKSLINIRNKREINKRNLFNTPPPLSRNLNPSKYASPHQRKNNSFLNLPIERDQEKPVDYFKLYSTGKYYTRKSPLPF